MPISQCRKFIRTRLGEVTYKYPRRKTARISLCVLVTLPVHLVHFKCLWVEVVDAVEVDGNHLFLSIVALAASKGLYATGFAEKVCNRLFVEAVLGEIIFALLERKVFCRDKGEEPAFHLAVRTVAAHGWLV